MKNYSVLDIFLLHLGCLAYDAETGEAFILNLEIADEFRVSMDNIGHWGIVAEALEKSDELLLGISYDGKEKPQLTN